VAGGENSPADSLAIQLGMNLWRDYGFNVDRVNLRKTILTHMPFWRHMAENVVKTPLAP